MTSHTSHLACFYAFRREQLERQIAYSTDPEWMRRMAGVHQHGDLFCVCLPIVGALIVMTICGLVAGI